MLENLDKKQKIIFIIIIGIMILFIIYYVSSGFLSSSDYSYIDSENFSNNIFELEAETATKQEEKNTLVTVYICGAVKESKVVSLPEHSRIIDALELVGGFSENADVNNVNLAALLEDGEKIYIPTIEENFEEETFSYSLQNKKININTANQSELETIPGVGSSTALKIINYRQTNGNFDSIEDIKEVSGIGDSKFENMKEYICVK